MLHITPGVLASFDGDLNQLLFSNEIVESEHVGSITSWLVIIIRGAHVVKIIQYELVLGVGNVKVEEPIGKSNSILAPTGPIYV